MLVGNSKGAGEEVGGGEPYITEPFKNCRYNAVNFIYFSNLKKN